ncbi:LacI family DNA-binding transcriptional regulator [Okibacterium fritillariae]|uniref:LacI family DNA-binding transcriptional regulator n=1 Tax=Okibacterium fritillariae TaxID=123320 RepID=UPI00405586D0
MRRSKAVTLVDVARLAGVSVATASKALNNRSEVREATKTRVHEAARSLSFEHNAMARSLSRGRSGTVGLLTSDLEGRFSLPILMAAEDAFGADEISVLLSDARGDAIREQRHVRTLAAKQVDALMVVGSLTDARRSLGASLPFPVAYVYTPSDDPSDFSLTPDNVQGGRIAAEHLLSTGRRRIAHVRGLPTAQAARDRALGIDAALTASGVPLEHRTDYGEWTERWGRSATLMLLDTHPEIDAVICDSDQIARGALDALHARGRRVPTDVALIGFDNWELITADTNPPISSVDMNLDLLGRRASELLFAAIDGSPLPTGIERTDCRLVARGTTIP